MLLCAIAPCSLFRHTMATLVAPFIYFLCAPSSGGCLCCLCASVHQHPGLSLPPNALRPQATRSFSRHSLPCQTDQRRPRTPLLPPPTPVEAAPFVGGPSPCF